MVNESLSASERRRITKKLCYGILYGATAGSKFVLHARRNGEQKAFNWSLHISRGGEEYDWTFLSNLPTSKKVFGKVKERLCSSRLCGDNAWPTKVDFEIRYPFALGNFRLIPNIYSANEFEKSAGERQAVNTICQVHRFPTLSPCFKASNWIRCREVQLMWWKRQWKTFPNFLKSPEARYFFEWNHFILSSYQQTILCLQIHDELLFEIPVVELNQVVVRHHYWVPSKSLIVAVAWEKNDERIRAGSSNTGIGERGTLVGSSPSFFGNHHSRFVSESVRIQADKSVFKRINQDVFLYRESWSRKKVGLAESKGDCNNA